MTKKIVITGVAGFIGSTAAVRLKQAGYEIIGIDWKYTNGYHRCDSFLQCDFSDPLSLEAIQEHQPVAVIHCAATSLVGPSIMDPMTYYINNVEKTIKLLNFITLNTKAKFIFASSAAVYGHTCGEVNEHNQTLPINPYGQTKAMIEKVCQHYHTAYGLKYNCMRLFNVCGADPSLQTGPELDDTHLIPRCVQSALYNKPIELFGANFETLDGSCVRDYVHVLDVVEALLLAITTDKIGIFNVGSGIGTSNIQIIDEVAKHIPLQYKIFSRREGDPDFLVCSNSKIRRMFGWKPAYSLEQIVKHTLDWYRLGSSKTQ